MNKFIALIMYAMWTVSLVGILVITFTNFQHLDLNIIVGVFFLFTLLNTYFSVKKK